MTKLLILFAVFILLFIPTCYNLGGLVLKKLNIQLNRYLTIFVGMFSLITMFQIAYYPAMTLQLPSLYLTIVGSIIVLLLLVLDIKNLKSFKEIFADKIIWISLIITGFIFFLYLRTMPGDLWNFDDAFYLPLMAGNANTSKLLSFQPRTGESINKLINIYSSQAYYMIGSYLISVFNIVKDFLSLKFNYLPIVYYFMAFPAFLSLVFVTIGMAQQLAKKRWQKALFISLFVFFTIFLAVDSNLLNNIIMAGYTGPFITLTIYTPFVLFCFNKYYDGDRNYSKLLMIAFFAMLSLASFNLFMIVILLYVLTFMLFVAKKDIIINDYLLFLLPVFMLLPSFLISNNIVAFTLQVLISIIYLGLFKVLKRPIKIDDRLYTIAKRIVFAVPFVFSGLSLLMICFNFFITCTPMELLLSLINTIFPLYGTLPFHYANILITGFYLFLTVCLILFIKSNFRKHNPLVVYLFVLVLTFINPVAIPFASTYVTSSTYNRVFVLLFNPYVSYIIIRDILEQLKFKKIGSITKERLVIIISVLLVVFSTAIEVKEFEFWVQTNGKSDKLYRMRERDYSASLLLNGFIKDYEIKDVVIASNYSELKVLNPDYRFLYDRTFVFSPDESFTKQNYYYTFLYDLNRGVINQEYYLKYGDDIMDVFEYTGVNFLTIDVHCPQLKNNHSSNILCKKPVEYKSNPLGYKEELVDYYEDMAIYKQLKKHLVLIYETDRYKLYYVE